MLSSLSPIVVALVCSEGGSLLNTPLNTPKCSVRVFRVFMNTPPEYSEYSDYSTEYSAWIL